ncbi:helix-turn-helix domain-containing protein [candidate division WWE3 bacterium]|nr:helix-turn-helix domain-containing protein [candidate division WWE3 bacterium]
MNYLDLEDRLYTSTEVAKILGVSLRSVYRYLEDAKLDAEIKTATGRHRFTKRNIMDFLSPQVSRKVVPSTSISNSSFEPSATFSDRVGSDKVIPQVDIVTEVDEDNTSVEVESDIDNDNTESAVYSPNPLKTTKLTPILDDDDDDIYTEVSSEVEQSITNEVVSSTTDEDTSYSKVKTYDDGVITTEERSTSTTRRTAKIDEKVDEVEDEGDVDWLAKFRAAAEKYKAEVKASEEPHVVEVPANANPKISTPPVQSSVKHVSDLTSIDDDDYESPKQTMSDEYFYTSSVGGLKDIAQNLDKSATKASLDYAFTMDAGLSLHKPIRPFSLIHSYVRSEDLPFFEKILGLKQVEKSDAQLCLIASDDNDIFSSSREMHGLKVVSNSQLKADLISEGKADLAKELS